MDRVVIEVMMLWTKSSKLACARQGDSLNSQLTVEGLLLV